MVGSNSYRFATPAGFGIDQSGGRGNDAAVDLTFKPGAGSAPKSGGIVDTLKDKTKEGLEGAKDLGKEGLDKAKGGLNALAGNHDRACTDPAALGWFNDQAAAVVRWTIEVLDYGGLEWLGGLPERATRGEVMLVHGRLFESVPR